MKKRIFFSILILNIVAYEAVPIDALSPHRYKPIEYKADTSEEQEKTED